MRRIWAFHAVSFVAAFLLFQIQPITSKALLPAFGGSYLVWGACMVFYQGMLLLGYLYAHFVQQRLGIGRYARLHLAVLFLPLLFFPFDFDRLGSAPGGAALGPAVFSLLFVTVSGPFLVLSTTSLVLQPWLAVSELPERRNPYVLYSASNLGSMLALLSYPLVVEPVMGLELQGRVWWCCYLLLVALHVACLPRRSGAPVRPEAEPSVGTGKRTVAGWFVLSLAAGAALLACTNVITFDVASVPFLWVVPLSIYLASFVLTFKRVPWHPAWIRGALSWAIVMGIVLYVMTQLRLAAPTMVSLLLHLGILFVVCVNCTGAMAANRPETHRRLTAFYVVIAAGGLSGSIIVSWLLPLMSSSLVEFPLAFLFAVAGLGLLSAPGPGPRAGLARMVARTVLPAAVPAAALLVVPWVLGRARTDGPVPSTLVLILAALPLALALRVALKRPVAGVVVLLTVAVVAGRMEGLLTRATNVTRLRNFYGIYKVYDEAGVRYLQHGTTQHGRQYLAGPKKGTPLSYYHPTTPAAGVMTSGQFSFSRVGMVGLGSGALGAYLRDGQELTVYELDPDNLQIARDSFTYLDIAESQGASVSCVFGDGRISLRARPDRSLELLIIDAFNSGSIPVHLLTVEAFAEYARVIGPDGLLLLHVSNKALDLVPVVYSNAAALGLEVCYKSNRDSVHPDADETHWVALSPDASRIDLLVGRLGWIGSAPRSLPRPWTDRYSNVFGALF